MKPYHKNPRQITKKKLSSLEDTLRRLGDLGGIVHNLETDEIIGGNQRMAVFQNGVPLVTETFTEPDEQGTVGLGYVVWKGKKYSYRQVRWDEQTAEEANIRANLSGGEWDWSSLANWNTDSLQSWGFDQDALQNWNTDAASLALMLEAENEEVEPPADFNEYGDDIETQYCCPKCGYAWSGKPE